MAERMCVSPRVQRYEIGQLRSFAMLPPILFLERTHGLTIKHLPPRQSSYPLVSSLAKVPFPLHEITEHEVEFLTKDLKNGVLQLTNEV
jgi:hypothetical protein